MSNVMYRNFEIAANGKPEEMRVEGYACTFEQPYVLYERYDGTKVYEVIDSNAFDGADLSDIVMKYDHQGKVLSRTSNDTLKVSVDNTGLRITADLSHSVAARELYEEIKNRLVTKMSIAFDVKETSFNKETNTIRILRFKKIYDVSAVSRPANENTNVEARTKDYEHYFNEGISPETLLNIKLKLVGGLHEQT